MFTLDISREISNENFFSNGIRWSLIMYCVAVFFSCRSERNWICWQYQLDIELTIRLIRVDTNSIECKKSRKTILRFYYGALILKSCYGVLITFLFKGHGYRAVDYAFTSKSEEVFKVIFVCFKNSGCNTIYFNFIVLTTFEVNIISNSEEKMNSTV